MDRAYTEIHTGGKQECITQMPHQFRCRFGVKCVRKNEKQNYIKCSSTDGDCEIAKRFRHSTSIRQLCFAEITFSLFRVAEDEVIRIQFAERRLLRFVIVDE